MEPPPPLHRPGGAGTAGQGEQRKGRDEELCRALCSTEGWGGSTVEDKMQGVGQCVGQCVGQESRQGLGNARRETMMSA